MTASTSACAQSHGWKQNATGRDVLMLWPWHHTPSLGGWELAGILGNAWGKVTHFVCDGHTWWNKCICGKRASLEFPSELCCCLIKGKCHWPWQWKPNVATWIAKSGVIQASCRIESPDYLKMMVLTTCLAMIWRHRVVTVVFTIGVHSAEFFPSVKLLKGYMDRWVPPVSPLKQRCLVNGGVLV